jgi:hypothetical protein
VWEDKKEKDIPSEDILERTFLTVTAGTCPGAWARDLSTDLSWDVGWDLSSDGRIAKNEEKTIRTRGHFYNGLH